MYKNCDKCAQINNVNNLFCIKCGNIFASEDYLLDFYKIRIPETEKVTERYFILRTIKSGGMGNIFMALDMHLDKVCAIKELRISSTDDDIDMEMFETEARLLSPCLLISDWYLTRISTGYCTILSRILNTRTMR